MEEGEISVDNTDGDSNNSDSLGTWAAHAVAQNQNKNLLATKTQN